MLSKLLQKLLAWFARRAIKKYKPVIIGITGSVGKSSTKEAIYTVLSSHFNSRRNLKNYNNEIGLPLTVLGRISGGKSLARWLRVFWMAVGTVFFPEKSYPELLVLEMAGDRPGDISYLINIALPQIGVVTAVGPVHLEFFGNLENIVREKQKIVEVLPPKGWAILNADDSRVLAMKASTWAKVLTYGFNGKADVRALEIEFDQELKKDVLHINGLRFKVAYAGSIVPVFLPDIISNAQVYSVLAAISCGVAMDLNVIEITDSLRRYQSLPGRMNPLRGVKNSLIIDDTYNSSPDAVKVALETMDRLNISPQAKKWIVLGDMLELGRDSDQLHQELGADLSRVKFEYLVTYGELAQNIAEGARRAGMKKENIFEFANLEEITNFLKEKIGRGDLILVKGSQRMRMERIVAVIMASPKMASKLLVRQGEDWLKNGVRPHF